VLNKYQGSIAHWTADQCPRFTHVACCVYRCIWDNRKINSKNDHKLLEWVTLTQQFSSENKQNSNSTLSLFLENLNFLLKNWRGNRGSGDFGNVVNGCTKIAKIVICYNKFMLSSVFHRCLVSILIFHTSLSSKIVRYTFCCWAGKYYDELK
jgi:hypothetical protein